MTAIRTTRTIAATAAVLLGIQGLQSLCAQGIEEHYVTPTVGSTTQRFGESVAISGNALVCGAPYDDTKGGDSGKAYVYRYDAAAETWNLEQELFASDPEASARFGSAVAISGSVLCVGAPLDDNSRGADAGTVYVFRYSDSTHLWSEEQKLVPGNGANDDEFGGALGLVNDVLVGGARFSDTAAGIDTGSAYVYRYKGGFLKWAEEQQLIDPDAEKIDLAGSSIAYDGTTIVIGAPQADEGAVSDCGSVEAWKHNGTSWVLEAEIAPATRLGKALFGTAVDIDGERVISGAPGEDSALSDTGAVYFFRKSGSTWVQDGRFESPVPNKLAKFGSSVAVRGSLAVAGSYLDDLNGRTDSGSMVTFRFGRGEWARDVVLGASDSSSSDRFANCIDINDVWVVTGADGNDTAKGSDVGVAYAYSTKEVILKIEPSQPAPGELTKFKAYYGKPGDTVMITVERVNGVPTFLPLITYLFGSDSALTLDISAPSPAIGLQLGLRSYRISATGSIVKSELEYVDV